MDTPFKCPYNNFSCPYYDTSQTDVSMLPCSDCKHFYNDVRMTGGMPNLEKFVNLIKKFMKKILILLIFVIVICSCTWVPELNNPKNPFIVRKISVRGNVEFSTYHGFFTKIILPTGMYNIGDTIILKK